VAFVALRNWQYLTSSLKNFCRVYNIFSAYIKVGGKKLR